MGRQTQAGPILVLAGATGVGKTQLAVALSRRLGGEIVGADSVQVYRGLDIGSCKPSADELAGVRHHMIDVLTPDQAIDAARYAALADAAITDIQARGGVVIVAGGTGLWLRALLRGLLPLPPVDAALRARLEAQWRADPAALHARLTRLDPLSAQRVHENDQVRVVRALEVYEQTGRPIGELRAAHAQGAPRYRALTLVLDVEPATWRDAIAERVQRMLQRGWVEETRGLLEVYGPDIRPLHSVGYRQLLPHVIEGAALADVVPQIERATRLYGKRQRNWFRSDPGVDLRASPRQALDSPVFDRLAAHLGRG